MTDEPAVSVVDTRVESLADGGDLTWVTVILEAQRDGVLTRWLDVATDLPFHAGHREHAVADHIPHLYDALVAFLRRSAPREQHTGPPLEDPAILDAARQHARVRSEQGLQPVDVVVEFRLLRQEMLAVVRESLPDGVPTGDALAANLLINDALDGAISIGLGSISDLIETVREDFLATTIHDVRQPLTLIKGIAQLSVRMLAREDVDIARVREELGRISAHVDHMTTMMGMLTDASRIALNHLELHHEPLDLARVIDDAIARFDATTAARFTVSADPGTDTHGEWDPMRISQVVGNLFSNAVKYSSPDSAVNVHLHGDAAQLEFSVRDHGIGVRPEEMSRLFQRYRRTTGAVDGNIEGLGLGLFLCRGIVVAMGGRIWAESAGEGLGTTFHVVLPRTAPTS